MSAARPAPGRARAPLLLARTRRRHAAGDGAPAAVPRAGTVSRSLRGADRGTRTGRHPGECRPVRVTAFPERRRGAARVAPALPSGLLGDLDLARDDLLLQLLELGLDVVDVAAGRGVADAVDRKSTRLNSSHVK